jgi:hypothetical protein
MKPALLFAALLLVPGCYRSHGIRNPEPDLDAAAGLDGSADSGTVMDAYRTPETPPFSWEDLCAVMLDDEPLYIGRYDVFCGNDYAIELLPNRTGMFAGEVAGPTPGRIVVNLEEARIRLTDLSEKEIVSGYETTVSGSVAPTAGGGGDGKVAVEAIPHRLADDAAEYDDRTVVLHVILAGRKMPGGDDVVSIPCRFPVDICDGCFTYYAEGTPSSPCDVGDEERREFERRHPGADLTGRGYDGSYCVCAASSADSCDDCGIE